MSISPNFEDIKQAYERIKGDVKKTPIVESSLLNKWMGNRILFKAECLQTIGAFKIRGAMNFLARLKEEGRLP
ncbi:MAG: pyridoxal-phosphate dependent enzyme, partial [Alteromonas macleodii]|nr:pyridoxal-phosphate dependent enzyme [Alteromonas macleodii]